MKKVIVLFLVILASCAGKENIMKNTLEVVPAVDLNKYIGTWCEIARYPNSFQKNCTATTATYSLREDAKIKVLNKARIRTIDGKEKSASGKAWVVDKKTNAKLKVQFFWPFRGDYWIIQLDKDYQWAVVGDPQRKNLWILSRTPEMDDDVYRKILHRLQEQGYNKDRLMRTGLNPVDED